MAIAEKCFFLTQKFPREERYGMAQQIRRSSSSIPANISEGYARRSAGDYKRFLNIAQGSINELQTFLLLAVKVHLCTEKDIEFILNSLKKESRMITSLINKLS